MEPDTLNANPPPPPMKPGILVVTLHEAKGLTLPPQYHHALSNSQVSNSVTAGAGGFSVAGSMRPNTASSRQGGTSFNPNGMRPQSSAGGYAAIPTIHGRYSSKHLPYALLDFDKNQVFVNAVSGSPDTPLWAGSNTAYKFDVSRATDLNISIYLRHPNATPGSGRAEDIFVGQVRVNPRFEVAHTYTEDPKASKKDKEKAAAAFAENERALGQSGPEWLDVQFGSGVMKVGVEYLENRQRTLKLDDFELLKVVGKGSFGKVMQVQYD